MTKVVRFDDFRITDFHESPTHDVIIIVTSGKQFKVVRAGRGYNVHNRECFAEGVQFCRTITEMKSVIRTK
jgi:hypothetical protein